MRLVMPAKAGIRVDRTPACAGVTMFAALLFLAAPCGAADMILREPVLSTDAALEIAHGALAACRKEGQKVSVTVVDASGRTRVSIRDDGAAPHTPEHSYRKAYTALSYKMPSADYGKRAAEAKGIAIGPQLLPGITTASGGVPIQMGKATLGAVGVSGTPSSAGGGEGDAKCAAAGLERIAKDLQAQ
jgi:uncharacterized protein GlcG (DUF336 family)